MSLPPPPPLPAPSPGGQAPRWPAAIGIMVVGLLILGGVAIAERTLDRRGPSHPDAWDPQVADLAGFVEQARGLTFRHPVFVDFLTAAEYSRASTDADRGATPTERADLARYAGELRALGVASGRLDLVAAFRQMSDGGTLAFYDSTDQRVRVRGTEMTVGLRVTLVHELTHALQDQRFDLGRLDDPDVDDGAATAFRGLAEGDALRIEEAYTSDELTAEERVDYDKEYAGALAASERATSDVPTFVSATYAAPYALGQPFAVMLFNRDGNRGVDRAFEHPPRTEEHLFDPASYLAHEGARLAIHLGFDGEARLLDQGPLGATTWYLFLAERIDPKEALEAALGWSGDDFAAVEEDGRTCVRAAFVGDTERDEEQMGAALADWVDVMPGTRAELDEVDGHPVLVSCDPGPDVDLRLTGRSESSLYLPSLWGYLVADGARTLDPEQARCYARSVIDALSYDDITDPEGEVLAGPAFQRTLSDAFDRCR